MTRIKRMMATVLSIGVCSLQLPLSPLISSADDAVIYSYDGYSIEYHVTNSWGNTDAVSVKITNTGTQVMRFLIQQMK